MYIKFSTRDIKEVYESLQYHTQWQEALWYSTLSTEWGMEGEGRARHAATVCGLWVVMWSLQPVLTLSHGINVCSHLTGNCMEILKGRI